MQTVTQNLEDAANSVCALLDDLFPEAIRLPDMNRGNGIVIMGPSHYFPQLTPEQRRVVSRLGEEFEHFMAVIHAMLRARPKDTQRTIDQCEKSIKSVVNQSHVSYTTTDTAKAGVRKNLDKLLSLISDLHDDSEGQVLLVPDTNALLLSPALESWQFSELDAFQLVLVPAVLAELDAHKMNHRNGDVRDKARGLIRQVKEYRSRGKLTVGVPVVSNRITLRALAVEPDLDASLPWLDSTISDDRILASCLEVMRSHPRASVVLVTADINLQNKAEFALMPFLEPPDVK